MSEHVPSRLDPNAPPALTGRRFNSSPEAEMRERLERLLRIAIERGDRISMYNLQHRIRRMQGYWTESELRLMHGDR